MTFNTRTTYTRKPVRLTIRLWGAADQCTMSQVPIYIPWHRDYWSKQLKALLKPHSIKSSNTPVSVYIMNHIFSSNGICNSYWRLAFYDKISLSIYHQIPDHHRWGMKKINWSQPTTSAMDTSDISTCSLQAGRHPKSHTPSHYTPCLAAPLPITYVTILQDNNSGPPEPAIISSLHHCLTPLHSMGNGKTLTLKTRYMAYF